MHDLIAEWRRFDVKTAPYVFPGDDVILENASAIHRHAHWEDFIKHPEFGAPGDTRLHLDLLPMPFVGNLQTASVFLLMLNPGLGPHDYFGEYTVAAYRDTLVANLRQDQANSFFFLNPQFSWHGGFQYWHGKLRSLISAFAVRSGISYGQARAVFQSKLAAIEVVPYHSESFSMRQGVLEKLRSAKLARSFVHDALLPRAAAGECVVIVTRASSAWGVLPHHPAVLYTGSEARSAHLTPGSKGGAAILKFLSADTHASGGGKVGLTRAHQGQESRVAPPSHPD